MGNIAVESAWRCIGRSVNKCPHCESQLGDAGDDLEKIWRQIGEVLETYWSF